MQKDRVAIIIVVDRLGAAFLGPYGNTWLETPHLNQLAAQSLVIEFPIVDSLELIDAYRAYWHGRHSFCTAASDGESLPKRLGASGANSTLISDSPGLFEKVPAAGDFEHRIMLPEPAAAGLADQIEQTHLAEVFAAAAEELVQCQPPHLAWIHCSGMQGPWDAPYDLRFQFTDEDDPEPTRSAEAPSRFLSQRADPDELLGITFAYAGQVSLLDSCLGVVLDAVADLGRHSEVLLVLTSPRGYPLGEHQRIGASEPALYGESLHVPWMLNCPATVTEAQRSQAIVQPHCAYQTVLDWFGEEGDVAPFYSTNLLSLLRNDCIGVADRGCSQAPDQRSIRTPAWFLRKAQSDVELYAKPDDRWDVNEVSDRCAEIVGELLTVLDEFENSARSRHGDPLSLLSDALLHGLDR